RVADAGVKPGVQRSETPGSRTEKNREPAKRLIAVPNTSTHRCRCRPLRGLQIFSTAGSRGYALRFTSGFMLSAAPRAWNVFNHRLPGVSLRFTPGFMPSPAPRV